MWFESTFSADDGGSWFGSVALFVVDPIWRFWRFPSETVIIARFPSGWIVGQMSGTAFPSSSSLARPPARWLRVVVHEQRFFFRFCVGWFSIIFGTPHNNRRVDLTNVSGANNAPLLPPSLVGRLAKSPLPACLLSLHR